MARSRRKTPVCGFTTARSEKQDKKIWHSRYRAAVRTHLMSGRDPALVPLPRQVSNVWDFDKDGKQRLDRNSFYYRKLMRK